MKGELICALLATFQSFTKPLSTSKIDSVQDSVRFDEVSIEHDQITQFYRIRFGDVDTIEQKQNF